MKKTLLFIVLSMACIMTHAQKADSTLLYGKWELYSIVADGASLCRDSMAENIKAMQSRKLYPGQQWSAADSVKAIRGYKARLDGMFKTSMKFDKDGNTSIIYGYENKDDRERSEENGKYVWLNEKQISQRLGASKPEVFTILALTTKKVTVRFGEGKEEAEMTFTRAK
jgi:hypothetical protein